MVTHRMQIDADQNLPGASPLPNEIKSTPKMGVYEMLRAVDTPRSYKSAPTTRRRCTSIARVDWRTSTTNPSARDTAPRVVFALVVDRASAARRIIVITMLAAIDQRRAHVRACARKSNASVERDPSWCARASARPWLSRTRLPKTARRVRRRRSSLRRVSRVAPGFRNAPTTTPIAHRPAPPACVGCRARSSLLRRRPARRLFAQYIDEAGVRACRRARSDASAREGDADRDARARRSSPIVLRRRRRPSALTRSSPRRATWSRATTARAALARRFHRSRRASPTTRRGTREGQATSRARRRLLLARVAALHNGRITSPAPPRKTPRRHARPTTPMRFRGGVRGRF